MKPTDELDAVRTLTIREVADCLRVADETVRAMIRRGELKAHRIGARYRVPLSAVRELLGQRDAEMSPEACERDSLVEMARAGMRLPGANGRPGSGRTSARS